MSKREAINSAQFNFKINLDGRIQYMYHWLFDCKLFGYFKHTHCRFGWF